MTRRILLTLGSTTTETHCGDCPFLGSDSGVGGSGYPMCRIVRDVIGDLDRIDGRLVPRRLVSCHDEERAVRDLLNAARREGVEIAKKNVFIDYKSRNYGTSINVVVDWDDVDAELARREADG